MIPYQDYLAIICTSTSTTEKSKVYLYDGSTITSYDIGAGRVFGGVYQEGSLIVGMTTLNKRYITFYAFNGVNFKPLYTYSARDNAASTPYSYIAGASLMKMFGNYNYFIVTGTRPDNSYSGIYEYALARFGRDDPNDPWSFSIIKNFDFTSARGLDGQITKNNFIVLESITGAAAIPDSYISTFIYSDTNKNTYFLSSASTYSAESGAVETFKQDGKEKGLDASIEKQLNSVSVFFAPLPSGGSVVLKYKKNEDTSWTTIFTHTTANSVEHSAVNIEATGGNLPVFNEIQYRIELLGGAELLGWKHKYTPMTQGNY